jgi:hypothetical protein
MSTRIINALLDERRGLAARGLVERVQQVDAELARLGYTPPVIEREVVPAPRRVDTTPKKKPARKKV